MAPGVGLYLRELYFDQYNARVRADQERYGVVVKSQELEGVERTETKVTDEVVDVEDPEEEAKADSPQVSVNLLPTVLMTIYCLLM